MSHMTPSLSIVLVAALALCGRMALVVHVTVAEGLGYVLGDASLRQPAGWTRTKVSPPEQVYLKLLIIVHPKLRREG